MTPRPTIKQPNSVVKCFLYTITNLLVGFLLALLIWSLIVKPYGQYLPAAIGSHLNKAGLLCSLILAIAYASFLKLRTRTILFLPTMLGTAAQNYILVILFIALVRGPMYSVTINAVESVRVIGCTLTITFELAKERAKLILNPIIEILRDESNEDLKQIRQELGHIQRLVVNMADFNQSLHATNKPTQTKTRTRTRPKRVDSKVVNDTIRKINKLTGKSSKNLSSVAEELFRNASVELDPGNFGVKVGLDAKGFQDLLEVGTRSSVDKFNLTDVMFQNCLNIFRGAKSSCDEAAEDMRQSCQDTIGPYFAAIWCSPVTFTLNTACPWIIDEIVNEDSLCHQFVQSLSNIKLSGQVIDINSVYKNLTDQISNLGDNLLRLNNTNDDGASQVSKRRLELSVTLSERTRTIFMRTKDLLDFITDKYRLRQAIWDALNFLYEAYTTYTFILIAFSSCEYHRNYLSKIQFDNYYITRQFVEYDKKRKLTGKSSVMPLKKDESETYITTFTCRRRTEEERKTQRAACAGIVFLVILTLVLIYLDSIFHSILVSVHEHAYVRYRQLGHHELEVKVIGEGSIARLVRRLTSRLSSVYDLNQLTSTKRCLPNARATSGRFYIEYTYLVLIYIGIDQLSIYAMRLRRVVCAFFYPEKEALRVKYLHRYLVYQRKKLDELGLTSYVGDSVDEDDDNNVYTIRDALDHLINCIRDSICCRPCRQVLFSTHQKGL